MRSSSRQSLYFHRPPSEQEPAIVKRSWFEKCHARYFRMRALGLVSRSFRKEMKPRNLASVSTVDEGDAGYPENKPLAPTPLELKSRLAHYKHSSLPTLQAMLAHPRNDFEQASPGNYTPSPPTYEGRIRPIIARAQTSPTMRPSMQQRRSTSGISVKFASSCFTNAAGVHGWKGHAKRPRRKTVVAEEEEEGVEEDAEGVEEEQMGVKEGMAFVDASENVLDTTS
ncbi:hypothetical protein K402DRAFT_240085 [Aulographum hederae CBS 113979]|uniref:Uncharacterized protein n=1 Tax=Aulographum hederae CBS 113979 TaxID=1176131 RepID=A0A6G1GKI3_9PEZI|nr:hypothetical protein K402DRAFT_240085 [Aulographum hederae CBS 113979]